MMLLRAKSADVLWGRALDRLVAESKHGYRESRAGSAVELMQVFAELSDPRRRWVASRTPPMNVAFAIVEVIGIIAGRNDSAYLNYFNRALPRFAGEGPTYHGAYGYRLRNAFGIDQIERAYSALAMNGTTRQVVLQIWDPKQDLPLESGAPASQDIPCNISSLLKVRDGRLFWTQIMRSNDVFRGLPYNLVQFTMLQEVLAGWLGVEMGSYCHMADSLHLYEVDLGTKASTELTKYARYEESVAIEKPVAELLWNVMSDRVDSLIESRNTESQMWSLSELPHSGLQNLMRIVVAEVARRTDRPSLAAALAESCTNPLLAGMWFRWMSERGQPALRA